MIDIHCDRIPPGCILRPLKYAMHPTPSKTICTLGALTAFSDSENDSDFHETGSTASSEDEPPSQEAPLQLKVDAGKEDRDEEDEEDRGIF